MCVLSVARGREVDHPPVPVGHVVGCSDRRRQVADIPVGEGRPGVVGLVRVGRRHLTWWDDVHLLSCLARGVRRRLALEEWDPREDQGVLQVG
jgi:hypothetical protein